MTNKKQEEPVNVFSAMTSIAFLIGLIVFEIGLYSYFSQDGSPWLIMFVVNMIYMMVAFFIISGLSMIGWVGMLVGYFISIVGLYLIGVSSFTL